MRRNDLNDGSIKALLIFVLIVANIAVAAQDRASSQPPGSARASRAVFGALAENIPGSRATRALGETRALPGQIPRQP